MIPNEAFDALTEESLRQLSELYDSFNCPPVECNRCIFALETPYEETFRCAIGYAKRLYGRLNR